MTNPSTVHHLLRRLPSDAQKQKAPALQPIPPAATEPTSARQPPSTRKVSATGSQTAEGNSPTPSTPAAVSARSTSEPGTSQENYSFTSSTSAHIAPPAGSGHIPPPAGTAVNLDLYTSTLARKPSGIEKVCVFNRGHFGSALGATVAEAEKEYLRRYPEIGKTAHIGDLRQTEFRRLDKKGQVYLDYTGGGLYAESQLQAHMEMLNDGVFGNPHSSNPTSQAMTVLVEATRRDILDFFNADPEEYDCIFTPNCTGALRLVGESYPFAEGGHYLLTTDNHNSVNGIREFAMAKGTPVTYIHVTPPNLRMDPDRVSEVLENLGDETHPKLFAYPAQSNFTGVQHPLEFIEIAQRHGWDVLLDAAAFAPTNKIDLSKIKPEYMSLSFYKLFGYPTGIGALIVKRKALQKLMQRPWFAGGTISVAFVSTGQHWLHMDHEAFEDGTINYLCIPAVKIGLDFMRRLGMDHIHNRVTAMTGWLMEQLLALQHKGGQRLVAVYGPQGKYHRGGTIALNVFDLTGHPIRPAMVETLANQCSISLRSGCFCNPGTSEDAFNWAQDELFAKLQALGRVPSKDDVYNLTHLAGAVRISVGVATNFNDLHRCFLFFASFLEKDFATVKAEVKAANEASGDAPHH